MSYSRKNPKKRVKDIPFWKKPLEFLDLLLYPKKFWRKQAFTPGNYAKVCDTPWKFRTYGNSTWVFLEHPREFHLFFLIEPWNFLMLLHMFFLQYPWKLHVLNHPWLDFFWNSPQIIFAPNNYLYIQIRPSKIYSSTAQNPYQKIEKDISISTVIVVSHFKKLNSIVKKNIDNLLFLASVS